MHQVYWGSGSRDCLLERPYDSVQQTRLLSIAERLLRSRGQEVAADFISKLHISIWSATNGFGDEFCALVGIGTPEEYTDWLDRFVDGSARSAFMHLASAVSEVLPDCYVRIIGLSVAADDEHPPVPAPATAGLAAEVARALADAEVLLTTQGPASAVDRVHTSVHAYFRSLCNDRGIATEADDSLTSVLKRLREDSNVLDPVGARSDDLKRIIGALSTIADAGNTIRNKASNAHPNPALESAEAMLTINALRTLFLYVQAKAR